MKDPRSPKQPRSGISRRTFFGAAAGTAALSLIGARPRIVSAAHDPLRDYVGRLCFNENPLGPSPLAMTAMIDEVAMGHRYGDWFAESLRQDIADLNGITRGQVIAAGGANEILRLCAQGYSSPDGNIVAPYPSYGSFGSFSEVYGSTVVHSALDENYRVDLDDLASKVDADTTAVCITNPNNPTGPVLPAADIEAFVDALPDGVVALIDEAYHEFVQDPDYESAVQLVLDEKDVVVVRTFSKAFGLAGVRIGYAMAKPGLLGAMNAWHTWGMVSRLAVAGARAALTDTQHVTDSVDHAIAAKQYCYNSLGGMGLQYIPSETNFFMVEVGDAATIAGDLADMDIHVRVGWGMQEHIRVSVGTMTEMEDFITALGEIMQLGANDRTRPHVNALYGNFPNPFRDGTRLKYTLAQDGPASIEVFDIRGRLVRRILDGSHPAGSHSFTWDGTDQRGRRLPAGSYLYRLNAGGTEQVRRMILMK